MRDYSNFYKTSTFESVVPVILTRIGSKVTIDGRIDICKDNKF